jgi:hypothetical protein
MRSIQPGAGTPDYAAIWEYRKTIDERIMPVMR